MFDLALCSILQNKQQDLMRTLEIVSIGIPDGIFFSSGHARVAVLVKKINTRTYTF